MTVAHLGLEEISLIMKSKLKNSNTNFINGVYQIIKENNRQYSGFNDLLEFAVQAYDKVAHEEKEHLILKEITIANHFIYTIFDCGHFQLNSKFKFDGVRLPLVSYDLDIIMETLVSILTKETGLAVTQIRAHVKSQIPHYSLSSTDRSNNRHLKNRIEDIKRQYTQIHKFFIQDLTEFKEELTNYVEFIDQDDQYNYQFYALAIKDTEKNLQSVATIRACYELLSSFDISNSGHITRANLLSNQIDEYIEHYEYVYLTIETEDRKFSATTITDHFKGAKREIQSAINQKKGYPYNGGYQVDILDNFAKDLEDAIKGTKGFELNFLHRSGREKLTPIPPQTVPQMSKHKSVLFCKICQLKLEQSFQIDGDWIEDNNLSLPEHCGQQMIWKITTDHN
ncbi:MAG: hypothetical protein OEZ01_04175 [Candidatus Heimdallarchaeota archaeon]|nr:hypothetical protein [Candidatus Heimdallarchaeota archaeon]MDH5645177.1 hypothetical protein [Candidatus Heimdallarchaeota archaeon]